MATANKVLKIEKSYVRSKPYGDSNIFNNHNGLAWCAYFQMYCANKAGMSWMKAIPNPAYCPNIETWAKSHGRWTLHGKPGDLVLFDWNQNKSPDHVGMLIEKKGSMYITVEGNTSNASNGNGGCVQIRYREAKWILGFVRPPYAKAVKKSTKAKYTGKYPSITLKLGSSGTQVKYLQKFLNWYLGYGLKCDGQFGAMTRRAVIAFQKKTGLTADGIFGAKSLAKSYSVTK